MVQRVKDTLEKHGQSIKKVMETIFNDFQRIIYMDRVRL